MTLRMPFGKHRGELLADIPSDYLRWMATTLDEDYLIAAAEEELARRLKPHARGRTNPAGPKRAKKVALDLDAVLEDIRKPADLDFPW